MNYYAVNGAPLNFKHLFVFFLKGREWGRGICVIQDLISIQLGK